MSNRIFSTVPVSKPRTNVFDLSHDRKMSLNFGKLVPVYVQECVPSDYVTIRNEVMLRFAPMVSPVMHRANVFMHYFFVPNRLLWSGWEDFITGNLPNDETPAFPTINWSNQDNVDNVLVEPGSLADYLGLPNSLPLTDFDLVEEPVSILPFAAYYKIWRDYYRDQNLQDDDDYPEVELADGPNNRIQNGVDLGELRSRAWTKDYFTSALPWAQKGDEVMLPLGSFQDVRVYTEEIAPNVVRPTRFRADIPAVVWPTTGSNDQMSYVQNGGDTTGALMRFESQLESPTQVAVDAYSSGFMASTSDLEAEAASINNLRRAFRLQEWLEKNARGGTRYTESIQVHFGVRPEDMRLQRPEYIGGSKQPVTISEVLNTVGNDERPQGDMAGHGISVGSSNKLKYFCREHGYIIGIMSVMPVPAYQQGIPRHFSKFDRFDYFWREFAHIGEQEILNKELVAVDDNTRNNSVFGYTPRYAEYRFMDSTVHGDFRTSLDHWHMSRIFDPASPPSLNEEFIKMDNSEVDRIFAVTDENVQKLWCHVFHRVRAKRPMPKFGVPSF